MAARRYPSRGSRNRRLRVEGLESRRLLSIAVADDPHFDESQHLYLPPQTNLQERGGFLTGPTAGEPLAIARDYLESNANAIGVAPGEIAGALVTRNYASSHTGTTHISMRQTLNDLPIANADLTINVTVDGEIVNVGSTFLGSLDPAEDPIAPTLTPAAAITRAAEILGYGLAGAPSLVSTTGGLSRKAVYNAPGLSLDPVPVQLQYVATPGGGVELAWQLVARTPDGDHWIDISIDATDGTSLFISDWVDHASYNVFGSPTADPQDGSRSIVVDPQILSASPFGWHDTNGAPGADFTDTRGNNVSAQDDTDANNTGGARPSGGAALVFDSPLDLTLGPANYLSAATTNLFYWVNLTHDIHHKYGFDEAAGNFQVNNYGNGGLGNDPVQADAQDGSGTDNANFATPPDGNSGRMQQFIFTATTPNRDSSLSADIIVHEFGHGVSNRLTGNANGLNAIQSRSMGEGWSDWHGLMLLQRPTDTQNGAFPVGNYVLGQPVSGPGIRRFPYSFDMSIDPLTYGAFNGGFPNNEVHNAGEIWASVLWDLNWVMIQKWDYEPDITKGFDPTDQFGNTFVLQVVMDGMKIQPNNPSMLDARDAILQSDLILTGGQNQFEIWTAFARRGMGLSADDGGGGNSTTVVEAFDIPPNLIPIPGEIHGTKFNDLDGNGFRDPGEPGLENWQIFLDINQNTLVDSGTLNFTAPGTPTTIPDNGKLRSRMQVSGLALPVVDINVTLDITHARAQDLDVFLVAPSKAKIPLFSDLPGTEFTGTTLDDEATDPIGTALPPYSGTFQPVGLLADFLDETSLNGFWTLEIFDDTTGETGTLNSWSMDISFSEPNSLTVADDPTTFAVDESGDYAITNIRAGNYLVSEVQQFGWVQTSPIGESLAVTEIRLGFPDSFEIENVSADPVDTAGWFIAISNAPYGSINLANPITIPLPAVMTPGQLLHKTDSISVSDDFFGSNIFWNGQNGRIGSGWIMIVDNGGSIVDWVGWGWSASQLNSFDVTVNGFNVVGLQGKWNGSTLPRLSNTGYQRTGSIDNNRAGDFSELPQPTINRHNGPLAFPFPFAGLPSPQFVTLAPGGVITDIDFGNQFTGGTIGDDDLEPPGGDPPVTDPPAGDPPADDDPPAGDPPGDGGFDDDPPVDDGGGDPPADDDPPIGDPPGDDDPPIADPPGDDPPIGDPPGDDDPPIADPPDDGPPDDGEPQDPPIAVPPLGPIVVDTIALHNAQSGAFFQRFANATGVADAAFGYGPGGTNWAPLSGDWDGDGMDTIGLYNPAAGAFFLRNENTAGAADSTFFYGPGGRGWQPLVGDWDADGRDSIGAYDPATGAFFLRNSLSNGAADVTFVYGPGGAGWTPMVGDWNGDGGDSVALYDPDHGAFFLRNTNAAGPADTAFGFGPTGNGWRVLAGDWDGDGTHSVGLYASNSAAFYLRNAHGPGAADHTFVYGPGGPAWTPIVGDWTGPIGETYRVAGTARMGGSAADLSQSQLDSAVDGILASWAVLGLDPAIASGLNSLQFRVANLAGNNIAVVQPGVITLDDDAAGHGWFVDPTPGTNEEFADMDDWYQAIHGSDADGLVDLYTVLARELCDAQGLDDAFPPEHDYDLLGDSLARGVRKTPAGDLHDELFG